MNRRACRLASGLVWLVAMSATASAQTIAAGREPAKVEVVGNDYTFVQFPITVAAGKTLFSFENRGRVRHEMSVTLLKPGVTMEEVMQAGLPRAQKLFDRIVGILIARPGESSGGELFVDLQRGRRYVVVCTLKDTPEARPHVELGMIASFEVP